MEHHNRDLDDYENINNLAPFTNFIDSMAPINLHYILMFDINDEARLFEIHIYRLTEGRWLDG